VDVAVVTIGSALMPDDQIVFLVDLDETLMDTERFDEDLGQFLQREIGTACRDRYWTIEQELFATLGYRDYCGALQRYRVEQPYDHRLNRVSSFMLDYPFAERLFPGALDVLARFHGWGKVVIVTDGDIILQPRKVQSSGIAHAVHDRVLIYIHKEQALPDIERLYPASHYVLVDDKHRILTALKKAWGGRVTTVRPRQGRFSKDTQSLAMYPPADLTVDYIADLLHYDLPLPGLHHATGAAK
jgi:hypothetical protein